MWIWASEANSLPDFAKRVMSFEEKLIFAEVNKNLLELAVFVSMLEENPTVLNLAVDNVNLSLCDLRDLSACLLRKIALLIV